MLRKLHAYNPSEASAAVKPQMLIAALQVVSHEMWCDTTG